MWAESLQWQWHQGYQQQWWQELRVSSLPPWGGLPQKNLLIHKGKVEPYLSP